MPLPQPAGAARRAEPGRADAAPRAAAFERPWSIGRFPMSGRALVAPMAGVTDRPYRQLCRRLGAGYAVGEMAASNPRLWHSVKTARRIDHDGEPAPKAVQIAGADPQMMAEAARFNVDRGADVIDINFGCPAKKVCSVRAGSALMDDEDLARRIVEAVVEAVQADGVPVTVKMRTGPSPQRRNAPRLARALEQTGIAMLVVHGRTRACRFDGPVEHDTLAEICATLSIPVVANGDIATPEQARRILHATGATAVMIGRAAQGRPWLYRQVDGLLADGVVPAAPTLAQWRGLLLEHLDAHYRFHGALTGARTARRHVGWYLDGLPELAGAQHLDEAGRDALRQAINRCDEPARQMALIARFLDADGPTPAAPPSAPQAVAAAAPRPAPQPVPVPVPAPVPRAAARTAPPAARTGPARAASEP